MSENIPSIYFITENASKLHTAGQYRNTKENG